MTTYRDDPLYRVNVVPVPISAIPDEQSEESLSFQEADDNVISSLQQQGYSRGLAKSLTNNNKTFPLRIWVVDNSGSMQIPDGTRIVSTKNKKSVKFVHCTRWIELNECILYHIEMVALLKAPTLFRLLNHPGVAVGSQQFSIGQTSRSDSSIMRDKQLAKTTLGKTRPFGVTPIISHLLEIHSLILGKATELNAKGQRVSVILATDGLPTDDRGQFGDLIRKQFVEALRLLEGLPVWIVIRLCTDEKEVVDFYNEIDDELEMSIEVLDDFMSEAKEIYKVNPWLNYALPLHRCREMGYYDRIFDLIDERKLTSGELREFCSLLFGEENFDGVKDPEEDWQSFLKTLQKLLEKEEKQWHPIKKGMHPWIDLKMLQRTYGDDAQCIIM